LKYFSKNLHLVISMPVSLPTSDPKGLLEKIRKTIEGKAVKTWEFRKDDRIIHNPEQWEKVAWFTSDIKEGVLAFNIVVPKGTTLTKGQFSILYGHFIEMLISHFWSDAGNISVKLP
jgi:hypothetical protein